MTYSNDLTLADLDNDGLSEIFFGASLNGSYALFYAVVDVTNGGLRRRGAFTPTDNAVRVLGAADIGGGRSVVVATPQGIRLVPASCHR